MRNTRELIIKAVDEQTYQYFETEDIENKLYTTIGMCFNGNIDISIIMPIDTPNDVYSKTIETVLALHLEKASNEEIIAKTNATAIYLNLRRNLYMRVFNFTDIDISTNLEGKECDESTDAYERLLVTDYIAKQINRFICEARSTNPNLPFAVKRAVETNEHFVGFHDSGDITFFSTIGMPLNGNVDLGFICFNSDGSRDISALLDGIKEMHLAGCTNEEIMRIYPDTVAMWIKTPTIGVFVNHLPETLHIRLVMEIGTGRIFQEFDYTEITADEANSKDYISNYANILRSSVSPKH